MKDVCAPNENVDDEKNESVMHFYSLNHSVCWGIKGIIMYLNQWFKTFGTNQRLQICLETIS